MNLHELQAALLVLRQKIHSLHWIVTGPSFLELHELFGDQYVAILEFADKIAEHIRQAGEYPILTLKSILAIGTEYIRELGNPKQMNWGDMVAVLAEDFTLLANLVNAMKAPDRGTSNTLDELQAYLNKQKWFLRSYLA